MNSKSWCTSFLSFFFESRIRGSLNQGQFQLTQPEIRCAGKMGVPAASGWNGEKEHHKERRMAHPGQTVWKGKFQGNITIKIKTSEAHSKYRSGCPLGDPNLIVGGTSTAFML